jgi:hypothetical protein
MRFRRVLIAVGAVVALVAFFAAMSPMRRYPTEGTGHPAARSSKPTPTPMVVPVKVQVLQPTHFATLPAWQSDHRTSSLHTLGYLQQIATETGVSAALLRYVELQPGTAMQCHSTRFGGSGVPYAFCAAQGVLVIDLGAIPSYYAQSKNEGRLAMTYVTLRWYAHALAHQLDYSRERLCLVGLMLRTLLDVGDVSEEEARDGMEKFYRPRYKGSALQGFTNGTCEDSR